MSATSPTTGAPTTVVVRIDRLVLPAWDAATAATFVDRFKDALGRRLAAMDGAVCSSPTVDGVVRGLVADAAASALEGGDAG